MHPVDDEESEPAAFVEEPMAARPQVKAKGLAGQTSSRTPLSYSAPAEDGSVQRAGKAPSKADDLYAKFKMCHGRPGAV